MSAGLDTLLDILLDKGVITLADVARVHDREWEDGMGEDL